LTNFRANVAVVSVQVVRCAADADQWRVAVNGQYIVGFYGPDARARAETHREELIEMLAAGDGSLATVFPHYDDGRDGATVSMRRTFVH
jgi:hypothetical protein